MQIECSQWAKHWFIIISVIISLWLFRSELLLLNIRIIYCKSLGSGVRGRKKSGGRRKRMNELACFVKRNLKP